MIRKTTTITTIILSITFLAAGQPQLGISQGPDITAENGEIRTTIEITNIGQDMQENWLIEQQIAEDNFFSTLTTTNLGRFSFVGPQQTCDPTNPQAVHRDFKLDAGDDRTITLTSTANIENGKSYNVKLLTVTGCTVGETAENNVKAVEPYGWGEIIDTVTVQDTSPDKTPGDNGGNTDTGNNNGETDKPSIDNPELIIGILGITILAGAVIIYG